MATAAAAIGASIAAKKGGKGAGFVNLITGLEGIFGTDVNVNSQSTGSSRTEASLSGENRDRLEISDEAIDKIVTDILRGPDGLASIFAGEQNAGVFNSSVANQAAGDLTAKISGEIAKLRAERVQTQEQTQTSATEQEQETKQQTEKEGLLKRIFG